MSDLNELYHHCKNKQINTLDRKNKRFEKVEKPHTDQINTLINMINNLHDTIKKCESNILEDNKKIKINLQNSINTAMTEDSKNINLDKYISTDKYEIVRYNNLQLQNQNEQLRLIIEELKKQTDKQKKYIDDLTENMKITGIEYNDVLKAKDSYIESLKKMIFTLEEQIKEKDHNILSYKNSIQKIDNVIEQEEQKNKIKKMDNKKIIDRKTNNKTLNNKTLNRFTHLKF